MRGFLGVFVGGLAVCVGFAAPSIADDRVFIQDAYVVDVEAGSISAPQSLLLVDRKIVAMGHELATPEGDFAFVDAAGRFLIPGFWDSHVHIFSTPDEPETALPLYLINGVTGIRDMGALWPIEAQLALQADIASGDVLGPQLVLAGAWVDASPGSWPGMFLADTPDVVPELVARIADEGWAAVKAYSMLDEQTYQALAGAVRHYGLPFVGHVPERVSLEMAIAAGQNGMEHFGRVTMACSLREDEMLDAIRAAMDQKAALPELFNIMAARNAIILDSWSEMRCREKLMKMARAEMHVSPTLVVADFYTGNWPNEDALRMQLTPASVREAWGKPDFRIEALTEEVLQLAEASIALDRKKHF